MLTKSNVVRATDMRRTWLIVVAILVAGGSDNCRAQSEEERLLGQSDPAIQDQISRICDALNEHPQLDLRGNIAALEEVQTLKNSVADKGEIVKQVAVFAVGPGEEGRPLYALGILDLLDFPPKIVIRTLAPYLDAKNENLRSFVRDWFQGYDNAGSDWSPLKPVNYDDYLSYVRVLSNKQEQIPPAFIEYIYERSPDRALLVFNSAGQGRDKDVRLAEHNISNAIWLHDKGFDEQFQKALPEATAELEKLSKHKEWWVRLYVAYVMRQHRELRQDAVIQGLAKDDNALVRKATQTKK